MWGEKTEILFYHTDGLFDFCYLSRVCQSDEAG